MLKAMSCYLEMEPSGGVHSYLPLLKLYSFNSKNCTCIDAIALGRFIPKNESTYVRDLQAASWTPLGSSALC